MQTEREPWTPANMLIDPPSPFHPHKEWEGNLKSIHELLEEHPDSGQIKRAIAEAEAELMRTHAGDDATGPRSDRTAASRPR